MVLLGWDMLSPGLEVEILKCDDMEGFLSTQETTGWQNDRWPLPANRMPVTIVQTGFGHR
jgi:hypothetical protein